MVEGLANGKSYSFSVKASNVMGTSKSSSPSSPVTPGRSPPDAPRNVIVTAGIRKATIAWETPASDGGAPVTGYRVRALSATGVACSTATASQVSCEITGLSDGGIYSFEVVAVNAEGEGPAAEAVVVLPSPPTEMAAPTAVPGNAQATVSWLPPGHDGGSPLTQYQVVLVSDTLKTCTALAGIHPGVYECTVTELANDMPHRFRVRAINAVGAGALSSPSDSVVPTSMPGVNWKKRNSGLPGGGLYGVTWMGSQFVAVGGGGNGKAVITTSPDAATWTTRLSNTASTLLSVATTGSLSVAVGDGGTILTSADGLNWAARASGTTNRLTSVTWTGTQFVAVGEQGNTSPPVLTSPDGVTWTLRSSGATSGHFESVTWNGSLLVAVMYGGAIRTSPDGITWTSRSSNVPNLQAVAWSGNQFIAVGGPNYSEYPLKSSLVTSPNGTNWTSRVTGTSEALQSVVWAGDRFIVGGNHGLLMSSPDGLTWTKRASGYTDVNATIQGFVWTGAKLVAVGYDGVSSPIVLTSP